MKTYKIKTTGKSLLELYEQYGVGSSGFYSSDPWWKNESFAGEKPPAGEYELYFDRALTGKTYSEQVKELQKGFDPVHIAIIAEAVLIHFKETEERLLEDLYVRSNSFNSNGYRVSVGHFDADGLLVNDWDGNYRLYDTGLSAARKLGDLNESLNLESAIKIVKEAGYRVIKEM